MSRDEKEFPKDDHDEVVDKLLNDLGVDDNMRKELVDSGRVSSDLLKVASADQVRRRMGIEKSIERLRDSMNLLERNVTQVESSIDRIERDLIPVVLSFLVSLKGNLVGVRNNVLDESKRNAKTNLHVTFVNTTLKQIIDQQFTPMEESLSSEMSAPILEKIREITDGFKDVLKLALDELSNLKASVEDYSQKTSTELEFLTKELSMKPRVEVPAEVQQQLDDLNVQAENLKKDLEIAQQRLENREAENISLQTNLAALKLRNESLEDAYESLKTSPVADASVVTELRQKVKALETEAELLQKRIADTESRLKSSEDMVADLKSEISKKELEIDDHREKVSRLEGEAGSINERLVEMDELRARVRSLESGDTMRELERTKSENERLMASNERFKNDYDTMKRQVEITEGRLNGYLGLMDSTEKTKAFLILEDSKEITIREVARSLGVSPAIMTQWAEDFVRLGIARIVDDTKLVLTIGDTGESSK
ncbi:MAG: coiled-coil domain-containing protein [Candidatus Thorarchaeota archaeon]